MTQMNQRKLGRKVSHVGWLMGLVIALCVSYISFEYARQEHYWIKLAYAQGKVLHEPDIMDVSIAITPPPPAPTPLAPLDPIIYPDPTPIVPSPDPTPVKEVKGPKKFTGPQRPTANLVPIGPLDPSALDIQAEFPGGLKGFYAYLGEHLKYPSLAKEMRIQGKVFVEFIVNADGKVSDIKIIRGLNGGLNEEAIRVMSQMPDWKPGEKRGKKVASKYKLPITFRLRTK